MKFREIILVSIILAILTIGAVSASDNTDFNETLTVDIAEEVSADASLDENDVSDGGDVIAALESDDVICDRNSTSGSGDVNPIFDGNSTKLNPGMNVNVEDTEYGEPVEVEITFDNLDSGEVSASVDGFNYAVNIVNGSGSLNICNLNIGSYILEVAYAGDDTYYATMVTAQFSVLPGENSTGEDGTGIIINGDDRFVYEYEAHESSSKGDDEVLRVRWDDVDGGTLTLTVRGDYITKTFDADIDGKNEYSWTLNDLGLENYGVYRFTLTYNDNVTIFSGLPFQLMWCNIEEYKDEDVYVDYPFDVIRIYEQPNTLELYVDDNENPSQPGNRQSSTFWNLGELGITSPGEYNILIKAYEDENLIETFSMTLNVIGFDENEYRIFTNYEGVHDFDGDAPVVYLYCPEDAEGNISVYVNDNFVGNFANDAGNMISWTLSDLGIDQNGDYSIVVKEGSDDEIAQTDLNIWHLGNGNNNDINLWVNTEDEFSTNPEDLPTIFAAVNVPEGTEGNVTFTIDGNVLYNLALSGFYDGRIDHENNIYNIALEVDGDFIFEGLNSEDVVKFAFLDENGDEVTSKEYMIFFGDNTVRFEENDNGNGEDNQIGVDIWDENDERGTLYTDSEGDVVGIYVPRDYEGTVFRIYVNGSETVSWEAEFDGDNQGEYKDWGLEELGISEAGDYNIVVESDNEEGREILSNTTITVSEFNEDTYRAMILYAREVIKFYTPQNCEGTITINTKKERGDDDYEEVFDETYEITEEYRGNWKEFALADIGFEADGAFRIFTITVNNATGDEVYSYRISHVGGEEEPNGDWYEENVEFGFNGPDDEPIEFNKTSDVLVAWLYIPDGIGHEDFADVSATVYIILNGEIIKTVRTSDFTEPLDWPNHYPIIMDLSHLQDRDQLSFRVDAIHENTSESAISEDEEERMVIIEDKGDYVIFHDDVDLERLEFDVFRGNLTLGTTNDPDLMGVIKYNLVIITISDSLGITEGTITVSDGESTVFTRQLSEFEKEYDYGSDGYTYYLSLDEVKDILPEGVNLTVSFNYADNTLAQKRIRFEDYLYSIVTVEDINNQFQFEVQDDLMLHENDTAIYLNTNTNRHAIYFDLGGGYFTVYVNGVKVENLGRVSFNTWMNKEYWRDDDDDYIERFNYDEEAFLNYVASYWGSELELFRLTSWNQGAPEIEITLADLGINESGTYNIRITHYPSVPGGLDDHSSLGVESIYAGEMLIPTVTEVLNTNITCNFDPDYAGVNIYPVTLYGNGIPFLFTFNFGDNIISESNSVLIYVDGELAFNSTILYYDENDEGEMELCDLWIVGPEMLSEDLFDECGYLAVGEYEAVVYLVKGDDAPVEIGRGNFSRIKQRGNMSFTIGSSVEGDGVHTIIYADIPEGDWTDYTLEIVIADSERVYSKGGGLYDYWFNEYVIFKDNQIYFKDSLENVIGKGPVAIDLGVLDEGTHIFVALEHGEETVFGDWDFYHYCFAVSNSNASAPNMSVFSSDINYGETATVEVYLPSDATGVVDATVAGVQYSGNIFNGYSSIILNGLDVGSYDVRVVYSGDENYLQAESYTSFSVLGTSRQVANLTIDAPDSVYEGDEFTVRITAPADATGIINFMIYDVYDDHMNVVKWDNGYLVNGVVTFTVSNLSVGNYLLEAHYDGDNKYLNASTSVGVPVLENENSSHRISPQMDVSAQDIIFGENEIIVVTLPEDATGAVQITVGNKIFTCNLINGTANFIIPYLAVNEYEVLAIYSGDDKYANVSVKTMFDVFKKESAISIAIPDIYYGESANCEVALSDSLNGTVNVFIGGMNYEVNVVNGYGALNISGLEVGNYNASAQFLGNENYLPSTTSMMFNVVRNNFSLSNVITQDILHYYIDENGVLLDSITFDELIFEGEFTGNSVENITINRPVKITGRDVSFNDISLVINADDVEVTDFTLHKPLFIKNANNVTVVNGIIISRENYALCAEGTSHLYILNSYMGLSSDDTRSRNNAVRISGSKDNPVSDIVLINDTIVASIPSVEVEWVNSTAWDYVANRMSEGVVFDYCENVKFIDNVINLTYSTSNGQYDAIYSLDFTNCQNALIESNTIESIGINYIYSLELDGCNNMTVLNNNIVSSSDYYVCAIDIENSREVEVNSNIIRAYSTNSAYGIHSYDSDLCSLNGNDISANSYWAVGISMFAQNNTVSDNIIKSCGNYTMGIGSVYDLTANNNTIVLNASNKGDEDIYDIFGIETVGFKSFGSAVLDGNTVSNSPKAMVVGENSTISSNIFEGESVFGNNSYAINNILEAVTLNGYHTNLTNNIIHGNVLMNASNCSLSTNNITGNVTVSNDGNDIVFNNIFSDSDYAVDLTTSKGCRVLENQLYAKELRGNAAVKDNGFNNVSGNLPSQLGITVEAANITVGENAVVNVLLSESVTGEVSIFLIGEYVNYTDLYYLSGENNHEFTIENIFFGKYVVEARYEDVAFNTTTFNVFRLNSTVSAEYDGGLLITLPDDATGNVTVTIGGAESTYSVFDGFAFVNVTDLDSGSYSAQITYGGDAKYLPSSTEVSFVIPLKGVALEVSAADVAVGENVTVVIHTSAGSVEVRIDGNVYVVDIANGVGVLTVGNFESGTHNVTVVFNGDSTHAAVMNYTSFNVFKLNSAVTAGYDGGLLITVPDDATGNVTVFVGGVESSYPVMDGFVFVNVTYLAPGNYSAQITYGGDAKYLPSTAQISFSVIRNSKSDAPISVEASNVVYGEPAVINIELPENASGSVSVSVGNMSCFADVINGKATVIISNLDVGNYTAVISYNGDESYNMNSTSVSFAVSDIEYLFDVADITVGDDATVYVHTSPAVTLNITVSIDNTYDRLISIADGQGSLILQELKAGNHIIKYNSQIIPFNVNKKQTDMEINFNNIFYGQDMIIDISMPDDAKGDVFMRLNGNHTESLADSAAQFTIADLEVGNYTVEIFYYNDEIYESVSQNITFSVLAPEEPFTFDLSVENITYGDNAEIRITASQNITETVNVTLCIVPQNVNSTSIPRTFTVDMVNGKGMLFIPDLNAENYSVNVKGIQKTFTVAPKQVTLTVDSIVYGEETVTLNLSDDLEGEIIITVAGVNYTAVIENKKATFNASGLDADNYTLNAVYIGNNNYRLKETTYQFNIGKVNATFNLTVDSITYSNDETIEIDVGPGITGKVYIDIGNYSFYTYVNNRKAIFNITGVDAGNYVATLRYEGNNNTYSNRVIYNITVKQADVNMSVHVGNMTYSKNNTIAVNVPEGLSGNITIIIGNRHYTQVIDNRIIIFHIDNFNAGNYLVTAIYEGNNNYYNKTVLYNITIEKMTVDFTADVREVSYKEQNALRVNVPEGVTGNVTVIIGNYTYDTVILDGVIEYYITNINAGNHEVRVIYRGNDNYYYNETVFNITVKKLDVDITLEQDKITYSKNNSFTLNIPEGVDGDIMVRIGNDTYNTVIYNGTATVNVLNIKAGNYLLEAVYAGNNNYNNVTRFFNITIEKMHVGIELGVGSVSYNKNQTINLIFPEEATGNVSIRIGNTTIRTTVVNGNATFNVVGINAGNYRAEVRYEGNDYYNEETTFVNISIEKVDVGITLETPTISYNDENELTIDMSDVATGNVTVEIGGEKFTSIINKGKASFSIMGVSAGIHTVKVTYAGDVNYNSAEAIFNLTVTKLNALLNVSYDDENIIVALPEDATGDVVAVITNNSYTGTVENGSANIQVDNLLPGDYTATISYMGDANYNGGVANVTFTVARISAPITVEADNIAEGEVAVINVALPENALGTVTVKVAGKSYTVTVKDGKASVEISGLSAGNYTVSAEYSGSEIYLPCSNTALLGVSKTFVEAGIEVNADDVAAGEDAVIAVTLPEDAEGTVTVAVNNREYTADVVNGKATVNLTGLNVGTYNATVSYSGDAKYLPDSKQVSFEVTKADILFNVSAEDVEFGEAIVIKATFPSDATGRAVLSIAGNTLTATIRNGVATFTTSGLLPDTYTATVTYNGNAKYDKTVQTAEFTVFKLEPVIDISAADIECGQDANIIVTLPDDAAGYVSIIVVGKEYSAEIIDGIAELTVPSLKAGQYNVSAVYDGDEIYTLANAAAVFKVSKINVTIDIIVNDVSAGENSKISIILPDDATGGFHYSAGGSTGYMSNFEGGEYVIEAVYGQAGTVSVKATYDGNDKYLPGEAETSFAVKALPVSMQITAEPVYAGETATITVTLPEDAVGSVSVSYPGGFRGSNINNGKYSFTTQFAAAGNYTISASFKSSGKYESVENSTVLVVSVKPAEPAMEITASDVKEGSDEVISVALPRDATGEVTLEVNGVKYTGAVKDGQATFTLSNLGEGDYNATVTYVGDVKYAQAVKTVSFTVKKDTIGTVIVMESKFTRYATDYSGGERGGEFSATLYDVDKNPLAGKGVQITVNGVIYNVTSDENGKVGLDVNLAAANTYTYALLFYGDEDYKASPIASSKLTVIKKPTSIIANDMAFKTSAKTKTVIVALNTIKNPFNGKMYLKEGKKLELKVDGKTYTAKTGKGGVAKFNIKISKKGKYTATVSFEGSVTYESATKKIKITVSKSPSKNKELKGVGSGMDPKDLDTDEKMNIEGNYSEYLENGNFSTSEISTDKKDAFIDVESKFTRLATDYGADERGGFFYARLIDSDGNPIAGKTVQISVNGPVYDVVTDSQGRAGLQVNLAAANTYTYALSFSGDDEYNPALIASSKLTVTKKTTFITAKSVSFKAKAKTKTVSVSLKTVNNPFDGKMYLKTGKKLTLKVNGKTYTAKINKNHVAKFNIKLTKKGKYTAKISFDGDATYEACSNSIKINIK